MQDNVLFLRSYSILTPNSFLLLFAVSEYFVHSPALIAGKHNHLVSGKPYSEYLLVNALLSNWAVMSVGILQGFLLSLVCSMFTNL